MYWHSTKFPSFAECHDHCTRQINRNCKFFFVFCIPLTQTVQIYITCHIYITNITIITYISQRNHFHTLYHNHNSNNNISQPQVKYHNHKSQIHNHSPSSPSTSHNHKWSSSPSTWRSTTPQKSGLWHDGEAKAPSFGDAWVGLFEPPTEAVKRIRGCMCEIHLVSFYVKHWCMS